MHKACTCIPMVPSWIFIKSDSEMKMVWREANDFYRAGHRPKMQIDGLWWFREQMCFAEPTLCFLKNWMSYQHWKIISFYIYKKYISVSPEKPEKSVYTGTTCPHGSIRHGLRSGWPQLTRHILPGYPSLAFSLISAICNRPSPEVFALIPPFVNKAVV